MAIQRNAIHQHFFVVLAVFVSQYLTNTLGLDLFQFWQGRVRNIIVHMVEMRIRELK